MFDHLKTMEEKHEAFVHFIATDYVELSADKAYDQRDRFIKLARKLVQEQNEIDGAVE